MKQKLGQRNSATSTRTAAEKKNTQGYLVEGSTHKPIGFPRTVSA
jgi:hypothetical protein